MHNGGTLISKKAHFILKTKLESSPELKSISLQIHNSSKSKLKNLSDPNIERLECINAWPLEAVLYGPTTTNYSVNDALDKEVVSSLLLNQ